MRTALFALLFAGLATTAAHAQVTSAEVYGAGIYSIGPTEAVIPDRSLATGERSIAADVGMAIPARTIHASPGTSLGITAVVHGRPTGRQIPVEVVWLYPRPGLHNPRTGKLDHADRYMTTMRIGEPKPFYWHMTSRWQAVPGPWTFEIRQGGHTLARHTFLVER